MTEAPPPAAVPPAVHHAARRRPARYAAAVLLVGAALGLRLALDSMVGPATPFITFYAAIALAARYLGFGPAILSLVLSYLAADFFFVPSSPRQLFDPAMTQIEHATRALTFGFVGAVLLSVARSLQRQSEAARGQARALRTELERRNAAEQEVARLRAEQGDLRRLAESNLVGVVVADERGRLYEANDAFLELVGFSREDLDAGRLRWQALTPPELRERDARKAAEARQHGSCTPYAKDFVLADGRRIPVLVGIAHLGGSRYIGFAVDLRPGNRVAEAQARALRAESALVAAEEALRVSEDQASLLGLAQVFVRDAEGRIVFWSRGAERLYGYSAAEAAGRESADLLRTRYPIPLEEIERGVLEGGEWLGELVHTTRDGRRLVVVAHWARWIGDDGRVRIVESLSDVTERVAARRALEEREHELAAANRGLQETLGELQSLFDTAPVVIWVARDPECRTVVGNRYASTLFGVPEGTNVSAEQAPDARPQQFRVCRDGRELAPEELSLQRAIATGAIVPNEEFEYHVADGRILSMMGNGVPLFDEAGRVRGAIGIFVDITERKRAEEALRDADRRKDEFLAMLAHELRNPLAPLRVGAELLRMNLSEAEREEARAMIDRQVSHMARLVDDLLDVSRITRGKVTLRNEPVDLRAVVRTAVDDARPLVERAGHVLALYGLDGGPPVRVEGDATRLAQVFANLLSNAAKFTEPDGRIDVALEPRETDAVVRVRDTGIGIPADLQPKVFDLFVQDATSPDRSRGGLGIGLTLARNLVELHGGTIRVASEGAGKGSEFAVVLPRLAAGAGAAAAGAPTAGAGAAGGLRILVVDDNADHVASLAMLLERRGHSVRRAYDGHAALDVCREFAPHVALLDLGLPGMDGYTLAAALRREPPCAETLLVAVSGYGADADRQRARDAGFSHHLLKPVDLEALGRVLEAARGRPTS